jgi:hypothetical protein
MTWSTDGVFAVAFDAFGTLLRSPEGASTPTRWLRARDADGTAAERRFLTRQEGLKELANEYNSSELLPLIEWEALHSVSRMQVHKEAPSLLTRMRETGTRVALCADVPGPCSRAIRTLVPQMDAYALSCDLSATTSERRFWEFVASVRLLQREQWDYALSLLGTKSESGWSSPSRSHCSAMFSPESTSKEPSAAVHRSGNECR